MNAKEIDDISCILQGSQLFENGRRNLETCETNILEMRLALSDLEAPFRNPHRMNASFRRHRCTVYFQLSASATRATVNHSPLGGCFIIFASATL
jgi:hypothetical protein